MVRTTDNAAELAMLDVAAQWTVELRERIGDSWAASLSVSAAAAWSSPSARAYRVAAEDWEAQLGQLWRGADITQDAIERARTQLTWVS